MTTRRQIVQWMPLLPVAGLLAACGEKVAPATPAASPPAAPTAAAPPPSSPPVAAATPETATQTPAPAAGGAVMLDEKDPQAAALGYVADAAKADKAKFPRYADGQNCANCVLYQGADAAQGGCSLYPGKNVAAKGWCSAYAKKAA